MKQWQVQPGPERRTLVQVEVSTPEPGPGEVRVDVHAVSLNFRDHLLLTGRYPLATDAPIVPVSDGAGVVTAVGPGVTRVSLGDRVTATTLPNWSDGRFDPAMRAEMIGFAVDGWLTEERLVPETALVRLPNTISCESAATFPCAGVTAWNAVIETGRIGPGDWVLAQGTGGVAMFGIQLAAMVGARSIITSSSDEKLARAMALGATKGINYRSTPEWDAAARDLTGGEGVHLVIEGAGTVHQSIQATRWGGTVAIIGALASLGSSHDAPDTRLPNLLRSGVTVTPVMMGNRRMLGRMVAAYATHHVDPVIDATYSFDDAPAAYEALAAARHMGKIVITR